VVVVKRAQADHLPTFALQADVFGNNVNNIVGLLNLKNRILVVNPGHFPFASMLVSVLGLAGGIITWLLRRQRVCQFTKIGIAASRRKVKPESKKLGKKCVLGATDRPAANSKTKICDFRQTVSRRLKFSQAVSR